MKNVNQLKIDSKELEKFKNNKSEFSMSGRIMLWIKHLSESESDQYDEAGLMFKEIAESKSISSLKETKPFNLKVTDQDSYRNFKRDLSVRGVSLNLAINIMIKKYNEQDFLFVAKIKI